jgi:hypothetical protein
VHRYNRRAVSPIVAQIFLVGLTVVLVTTLFAFRPALPPQPSKLYYQVQAGGSEPAWGDGSDCTTVNNVQTCLSLPVIGITLTVSSPGTLLVSSLTFYLFCNGTIYLTAPLKQMEWVPGTAATVGGGAPQLGHCGSYTPPSAAWNRLAYFNQLVPAHTTIVTGDYIVLYAHSFQPPNCPSNNPCDDDFHGAPEWCYTVVNACTLILAYQGPPSATEMSVPLYGLST